MKLIVRFAFVLCAVGTTALAGPTIIKAQTPLARFVLPTNTTATAVQPTFEIITSLPMDTTSVHWSADTTDSTTNYGPTICVVPFDFYQKNSDTLWPIQAFGGTGTIINDTTIQFTVQTLCNHFECEAIIMGLRLISGADTITVPDSVARITFTTIDLPPSLLGTSFIGKQVFSHDTLSVFFRKKLDSTNSASGPIVSLIIPTIIDDVAHDTVYKMDSAISATTWLDATDSSTIHILPNQPFAPGKSYALKIALSGLTGDTDDDGCWGFTCRQSYRLNILAAPTAGLSCLGTVHFNPPINESYKMVYDSAFDSSTMAEQYDTAVVYDSSQLGIVLNADDSVTYIAPKQVGAAIFKQWSGSGNPAIDTSTNPILTVTETSGQLHDMTVTALYTVVTTDTICVSTGGVNSAGRNSDFVAISGDTQDCPFTTPNDTCASTSNITYFTEPGKTITLQAYSTSDTIFFDHWASSDPSINGQTSAILAMQPSGSTCATAIFGSGTGRGGPGCSNTIIVNIFDESTSQYVTTGIGGSSTGVASISPLAPCTSNTWCACDVLQTQYILKVNLLDISYAVDKYTITGPAPTTPGTKVLNPPFSGAPYFYAVPNGVPPAGYKTYSTAPNTTYVTFYIKKAFNSLTIQTTLEDDNTLTSMLITPSFEGSVKPTDAYIQVNQEPSHITQGPYAADKDHPNSYQWVLDYPFTTTSVSVTSGTKKTNLTFDKWEQGSPNTDPTSVPPHTNPLAVSMNQNRYVTALYQEPFVLTDIGWYYINGSGQTIYKKVHDPDNNWPPPADNTGVQPDLAVVAKPSTWSSTNPPEIDFWFNGTVVYNNYGEANGLDYGPIATEEDGTAFDINTLTSQPGMRIYNQNILGSKNSMWFGLSQHGGYIWKGQKFNIDITNILSDQLEFPSNKTKIFQFKTVEPDIRWRIPTAVVYNTHESFWFTSNSWIIWASQYGIPDNSPLASADLNQGFYNGGGSCFDTITDRFEYMQVPEAPLHAGNDLTYNTTEKVCQDWGDGRLGNTLGLILIGSEHVPYSNTLDGGYITQISYGATCSAGVLNSVVNPIYKVSDWTGGWFRPYPQYDYGHLSGVDIDQKDVMGKDFNYGAGPYTPPTGWLTPAQIADIPDDMGEYIHYRLQVPIDAIEVDNTGTEVGWWENISYSYPRAGRIDFWGAGTWYKKTYWNAASNGNASITLQVDIQ